jgi:hypothetical protein
MIDTEMEVYLRDGQYNELLKQFKDLHPNNTENLQPTPETIARLQWHIKEGLKKTQYDEVEKVDVSHWEQLRESRKSNYWTELPDYMRSNYLKIADYWAGQQCYAVGSRVNGDYIEQWSHSGIREMRRAFGKPEKEESDYDYMMDFVGQFGIIASLDELYMESNTGVKADLIRHLPPNARKIPIPMWDFTKLPEAKKQEAKELFAAKKWGELMKMHNDFELSENYYCCTEAPVIKWFKWAIENGKI